MASGIEVAQAYVTIIPSMRGSQSEIADALGAETVGQQAGATIGEGIGAGLSAKAVVVGNILTDVITGAVSKAVDVGKEIAGGIYDGFAANEQLVGGMQKLFGDDATAVIANASDAWKTAGMSANQYMENVTGFAASLVKSTGGDTAEAARLADVAMRAMSDNVNTFGTDAESVQNAIQGLAKGNYTMLDNLSLGFSGTQQGMLDLINASGVLDHELTDTKELADVGFGTMVEAIAAVQDQMSITGTTANEAMGTLEGSATATKAAWENVLTAIGSGDASAVQSATNGLVDAVFGTIDEETGAREGGLVSNLTTLAQNAFNALGAALPGMVDTALNALPPDIGGPLREAFETIGNVVGTVAPVVASAVNTLVTAIARIAPVVAPLLPIIAGAMAAVQIVGVIGGIVGAITTFVSTASAAIGMISGLPALIGAIVTLLGGPVTIIAAIVGAIIAFVATNEDARNKVIEVWEAIKAKVTELAGAVAEFVPKKWEELKARVTGVLNSVKTVVSSAWNAVKSTASNAVSSMVSNVTSRFNSLKSRATSIFNAVKSAIVNPINTAKSLVSNAISSIGSIVRGVNLSLPHISLPHFSVSGGSAPWGIGGKGSMPSFSVQWYARGGYFDDPTLFAGVGERGGEFVWPSYAPYLDRYADALSERMGGGNVTVNLSYSGSGDATDLVRTLTRELRLLKMTGAI